MLAPSYKYTVILFDDINIVWHNKAFYRTPSSEEQIIQCKV